MVYNDYVVLTLHDAERKILEDQAKQNHLVQVIKETLQRTPRKLRRLRLW
ncbi:MAG: hypothetical protein MUE40_19020 [Anaerolineae bacterium]|jgi:hypothetical protein|nr:hypothetical protein [Anaerolineae bacterium]